MPPPIYFILVVYTCTYQFSQVDDWSWLKSDFSILFTLTKMWNNIQTNWNFSNNEPVQKWGIICLYFYFSTLAMWRCSLANILGVEVYMSSNCQGWETLVLSNIFGSVRLRMPHSAIST